MLWFQSTLPRRKRLSFHWSSNYWPSFQSTLPRRKRQNPSSACLRHWYDFNPRFREGSDSNTVIKTDLGVTISIHASAKEATESNYSAALPVLFQSTLPRRKRPCLRSWPAASGNFNPRFREGSDDFVRFAEIFKTISIHASAKEATQSAVAVVELLNRFQSTLPRRKRQQICTIFLCISAKIIAQLTN